MPNFLTDYNLLVNIKNIRLLDQLISFTPGAVVTRDSTKIFTVCATAPCASLLKYFPALRQPNSATKPVKNHVTHQIETADPPVHTNARRLPPERFHAPKAESESLLRQSIIRPSSSNRSSALHIISKKDSNIRLCGDYRALNSCTVMDRHPVHNIKEFLSKLHGSTIFSRIDLVEAFHQISVYPEDIPKKPIITTFGLFEYVRMPFGLRNAAHSFQRFMDKVL